jgi:hypothetical protein
MMTHPRKSQKQKKGKKPQQIADLTLNKETMANLTDADAEHVKGGLRVREIDPEEEDVTQL